MVGPGNAWPGLPWVNGEPRLLGGMVRGIYIIRFAGYLQAHFGVIYIRCVGYGLLSAANGHLFTGF